MLAKVGSAGVGDQRSELMWVVGWLKSRGCLDDRTEGVGIGKGWAKWQV